MIDNRMAEWKLTIGRTGGLVIRKYHSCRAILSCKQCGRCTRFFFFFGFFKKPFLINLNQFTHSRNKRLQFESRLWPSFSSFLCLPPLDVMAVSFQQCRRPWFAGNIEHIVIVIEAVEFGSAAFGIRPHLLEVEPISDV